MRDPKTGKLVGIKVPEAMGIVSGGVYLFVTVVFLPFAFVSCEGPNGDFGSELRYAFNSPEFPYSLMALIPAFGSSDSGAGGIQCQSALL